MFSPPKCNALVAVAADDVDDIIVFLLRFVRSRNLAEDGDSCSPLACAAICDAVPSATLPNGDWLYLRLFSCANANKSSAESNLKSCFRNPNFFACELTFLVFNVAHELNPVGNNPRDFAVSANRSNVSGAFG